MTVWRQIPSLPKYLASSDGQIRHQDSVEPRKVQRSDRGYCYVSFAGVRRLCTVHSLIAEAFIGPRPAGAQIRHLDGDPTNNASSNPAYGSAKENAEDRERHGNTARGERGGMTRLSDANVDMLRIVYAAGLFDQRQLAVLFKISQAQVNNIVLNKQRVRQVA